jgi:tyrosinase
MVDRYRTDPLELPSPEHPFARADLIFYGIDHSGDSFEGRTYLNAPRNLAHDAGREHPSYVGSFFIFGHGGCFGEEGHCDIPTDRDPFDLRPPHPLEPAIRILTVTEPVRRLVESGVTEATVTVTAHSAGEGSNDVLAFETVRLVTYTDVGAATPTPPRP